MAQPNMTYTVHVEIDMKPARRLIKRAIRDLEEVNREMARLEERYEDLRRRMAAEYGIDYTKETTP